MEASFFFFFLLSGRSFPIWKKPPLLTLMKENHNSGVVMTGLCTTLSLPPPGHSPLCSPQAELLSPQCKGGERKQARLPNANSIMTSHGGEREYGAVFEVARLQEALQLQPRYRKLLHRFYRALDLNRLSAASTHCSTHSLHRLRLY